MNEYTCPCCGNIFKRYKFHVRTSRPYCSRKCAAASKDLTGKNNNNYRHGECCTPSKCACGATKDRRAKLCAKCAGVGFVMGARDKPVVDRAAFTAAVAVCNSYNTLAVKLGICRNSVAKLVRLFSPNIDHFKRTTYRRYTARIALVKGTKRLPGPTLRYLLVHELNRPSTCAQCGIGTTWKGKPLVLQVHHKNGDSTDNRRRNLQLLCPNCHTQTDTFTGRNRHMNSNTVKETLKVSVGGAL